jgi:hypothetical protein
MATDCPAILPGLSTDQADTQWPTKPPHSGHVLFGRTERLALSGRIPSATFERSEPGEAVPSCPAMPMSMRDNCGDCAQGTIIPRAKDLIAGQTNRSIHLSTADVHQENPETRELHARRTTSTIPDTANPIVGEPACA